MKRTFGSSALITLVITVAVFLLNTLLKIAIDYGKDFFTEEAKKTIFIISLWALPIVFVGSIILVISLAITNGSINSSDNTEFKIDHKDTKERIKFFQRNLSNQNRILIIITLIEVTAINVINLFFRSSISNILTISVTAIIIFNSIKEFYSITSLIRDTISKMLEQIVESFASQIDLLIFEALGGEKQYDTRIYILLYSSTTQNFHMKYSYNMMGFPDYKMEIGSTQGIVGRVFKSSRPMGLVKYDPNQLNLSPNQIERIPVDIKWKLCFPLLCDHHVFGVLAIDSNSPLEKKWLDKILDFAHATITAVAILIGAYPGKDTQDAYRESKIEE